MKRSPLSRNTPLKRSSKPLARTGKLNPGRHKTYGTWEERAAFKRSTWDEPCVVCGRTVAEALFHTGHGHEAHHALSQQSLKRRGLEAHLWDTRNAVTLCEEPCHPRHTSRLRPVFWDELPDPAKDFADGLGLLYLLTRTYPMKEERDA